MFTKKVIAQILALYLTTTGIFLIIFFVIWHQKLLDNLTNEHTRVLKDAHRNIVLSILNAKQTPIEQTCKNIASVSSIKFAILDERQVLCSDLDFALDDINVSLRQQGIYKEHIFYLAAMNPSAYYLNTLKDRKELSIQNGALRTFIQGQDVSKELLYIRFWLGFALLFSFLILALVSFFLVKIALKPLNEKISTLNSFIKDFTHEINTPLSVILLSIEQIEQNDGKVAENKLKRMKLASKTLSQTYSDLIFYTFPDTIASQDEELKMKDLIQERLEYFKLFFEQKKLEISANLDDSTLFASKNKINKLLDNLISNAIKYNKKGGFIKINLYQNCLSIQDSGCGIEEKNLKAIFSRYARFNQDQGGFGIGLSLVQGICKEYHIELDCTSALNKGSKFELKWQKKIRKSLIYLLKFAKMKLKNFKNIFKI